MTFYMNQHFIDPRLNFRYIFDIIKVSCFGICVNIDVWRHNVLWSAVLSCGKPPHIINIENGDGLMRLQNYEKCQLPKLFLITFHTF